MEQLHGPPPSVDLGEGEDDSDLAQSERHSAPAPVHFWRALLASIVAYAGLIGVLDAIPVRSGEALGLRWLRALAEHPLRGPLGLALGYVAAVQLARAVFNRASRP